MKHVILDCDPGHDDVLALMMALYQTHDLDVTGVVTSAGNQSLSKVTHNAFNVLRYLHRDVPLVAGESGALLASQTTTGDGDAIHGQSGLGGFEFQENTQWQSQVDHDYLHFYRGELSAGPRTIIATAPLTNVAMVIKSMPELVKNIEEISLMGGGLHHGNITPAAEFNIYADPEAAKIVFNAGIPITMSGLDVTEKAFLTADEIRALGHGTGKATTMVYHLLDFYSHYFTQQRVDEMPLHDVCAVLALTNPEMFTSIQTVVDVETNDGIAKGQTIADLRVIQDAQQTKNVTALLSIDRQLFKEALLKMLAHFDADLA